MEEKWEQVRINAAIAAMQGFITIATFTNPEREKAIAELSVLQADALVKELKLGNSGNEDEREYTYKEMENAVHLANDLCVDLYEKWGDMRATAEFIIQKAVELDKHLGGKNEDEGNYDYVEELEKFEKKTLAEL